MSTQICLLKANETQRQRADTTCAKKKIRSNKHKGKLFLRLAGAWLQCRRQFQ
jgi:hypothetical protein